MFHARFGRPAAADVTALRAPSEWLPAALLPILGESTGAQDATVGHPDVLASGRPQLRELLDRPFQEAPMSVENRRSVANMEV